MKWLLFLLSFIFSITCCTERKDDSLRKLDVVDVSDISEIIKNPITANKDNEDHKEGLIPTMDFESLVFDFGAISQGESVKHDFVFKNIGTGPLFIHEARTTCGCTVPSYPRDAVAIGGQDTVSVLFNSANKIGKQVKEIRIFANTIPKETTLKVIGIVNPN